MSGADPGVAGDDGIARGTLPLPEPEKVKVLAPKRAKALSLRSWMGLRVAVKKVPELRMS